MLNQYNDGACSNEEDVVQGSLRGLQEESAHSEDIETNIDPNLAREGPGETP